MCIELKIKAKHLALEPAIIRKEEAKLKKQMKYHRGEEGSYWQFSRKLNDLSNHRRWNVRNEARATELARTYLAGKPYLHCEHRSVMNDGMFQLYIVPRVHAMVTKYGSREQRQIEKKDIVEWSKLY